MRFFNKAISSNSEPTKINIDKSGANTAGIDAYNYDEVAYIEIRQCKYLNNIVEQDHRFIEKKVGPTLGFKSFRTAVATIAGIELMHMIRKGQMRKTNGRHQTPAIATMLLILYYRVVRFKHYEV